MKRCKPLLWIAGCALLMSGCDSVNEVSDPSKTSDTGTVATQEPMAYGRFVPEREDDFAWENDRVAFRVYGPGSSSVGTISGVDAWLKRVSYPIIDKWYAQEKRGKSYYEDHGEGYDPYHTGSSRGVGGTALWIDGVPYPAGSFRNYEIFSNRGDEVRFSLQYFWETPLGTVSEKKTVSLQLGEQLYSVDSVFTLDGEPAALPVAIGLTTHNGAATTYSNEETGRISTWETIDAHGLGTGVLIDPENMHDVIRTDSEVDDRSHIWIVTTTDDAGRLSFRAGYAWQMAGEIETIEEWNQYLDTRAD